MPNLWDQEALRKRAKDKLARRAAPAGAGGVDEGALAEEVRIHQAELEIQNKELRRALADMEFSREKYYNLYDLAPVGYLTVNGAGFIREANGAAARLLGTDRERLKSRPLIRFIAMDDRLRLDRLLKDITESDVKQSCELRLVDAEKRAVHVRLEGIAFKRARSEPEYLIAVIDLSREDESEQKLRNAYKELEGANEVLKGEIAQREHAEDAMKFAKSEAELYLDLMGHDINNLNQISIGFLELAYNIIEYEGKLGKDNIYLMEKAIDSLQNSSRLIDNVRKIQREKAGYYRMKVVDMTAIIREVVSEFSYIAGRDVRISFNGDGARMPVKANELLKDVFLNLVNNAIKHSSGALSIAIRATPTEEGGRSYYSIAIEDDGPGIPDLQKSRLFQRFTDGNGRAHGKGLGLYLVKTLVNDYNGRVKVEDRVPGDYTKGARFVVLLPVAEQ